MQFYLKTSILEYSIIKLKLRWKLRYLHCQGKFKAIMCLYRINYLEFKLLLFILLVYSKRLQTK